MEAGKLRRSGSAFSDCRKRKGRKMDKIDGEKFKYANKEAREKLLFSKMNELIDENTELIYDYKELEKKVYELKEGYNETMKRFKKDMEHDEVMDGITMEKGEELADHLNNHINLIKDGLRKKKN